MNNIISFIRAGNDRVLQSLPTDILYLISVQYLSVDDILKLCQTSKTFNTRICNNPNVWRQLYQRDISSNISNITDFKKKYIDIMKEFRNYNTINRKLIAAIFLGYDKLVIKYLNEDISLNGLFDRNPLLVAIKNNHVNIVRILLDYGANPNLWDGAPLRVAIENNNTEMINLLINRGADINLV